MHIPTIAIRGDDIRLGQFIKYANLVATGGEAKEAIAAGMVHINGEVSTQRGKVLRPGDEVTLHDEQSAELLAGARVGGGAGAAGAANTAGSTDGAGNLGDSSDLADDDDLGEFFDEATANDDFDPEKWRNL